VRDIHTACTFFTPKTTKRTSRSDQGLRVHTKGRRQSADRLSGRPMSLHRQPSSPSPARRERVSAQRRRECIFQPSPARRERVSAQRRGEGTFQPSPAHGRGSPRSGGVRASPPLVNTRDRCYNHPRRVGRRRGVPLPAPQVTRPVAAATRTPAAIRSAPKADFQWRRAWPTSTPTVHCSLFTVHSARVPDP
jgi:hypothetical protein